MNTEQFLAAILPDRGIRFVVSIGAQGTRQVGMDTNADAVRAISRIDNQGNNAYHACATYKDKSGRKADNVLEVQALWLDLDCGPSKDYATQDDALDALEAFRAKLVLPKPMVINSGRGIHAYWRLEQAVDPTTWKPTALLLKKACIQFGLRADPSRTSDVASILRPAGSHNRKSSPVLVEVLEDGRVAPISYIHQQLTSFVGEDDLGSKPAHVTGGDNDALGTKAPLPLRDANVVANGCSIMGEFRADGGANFSEPLWRDAIGVLTQCEDGERLAHEWSAQDPRYTKDETQKKWDGWAGGATTCKTFEGHCPNVCKACPFYGKITSPVTASPIPVTPQVTSSPVDPLDPVKPEFFYDAQARRPGIYTKMTDKKGDEYNALVTETLFYALAATRAKSGQHSLVIRVHKSKTETQDFELNNSMIYDAKLQGYLAAHNIMVEPRMTPAMQVKLNRWVNFHRLNAASPTQDHFGWTDDDNFVFGNQLYRKDGTQIQVLLSGTAKTQGSNIKPTGDLNVWKYIMERAYNHAETIPMQFAVCTSMGTPLLKLFEDYGGVTVHMHSRESGQGKTTVERAALSVWCDWQDAQITQRAVTENAFGGVLSAYRNLPLVLDEVTKMEAKAAGDLVHQISSGSPKLRANKDGIVINHGHRWQTIVLASGNNLFGEKLKYSRGHAEAERARLWEYTLPDVRELGIIKSDEAFELFPKLSRNYGVAGEVLVRYIVAHKDEVHKKLQAVQQKLNASLKFKQEERYWLALLSCSVTALLIARDLKLVNFPVAPFMAWLKEILAENRASLRSSVSTPADMLHRMISDLYPRFIITEGPGNLPHDDAQVRSRPQGGKSVAGRICTPRGMSLYGPATMASMWVAERAANEWAQKEGISAKDVFDQGVKAGLLSPAVARKTLGSGSKEFAGAGVNEKVWVYNSHKLDTLFAGLGLASGPMMVVQQGGKTP